MEATATTARDLLLALDAAMVNVRDRALRLGATQEQADRWAVEALKNHLAEVATLLTLEA
jgi:hypothetical protein